MSRYYNDYYGLDSSSLELEHFGVLGQRKGARRYQYEDGSLTPLGRIHYGIGAAREAATILFKGNHKNIEKQQVSEEEKRKQKEAAKVEAERKAEQERKAKEEAERKAEEAKKNEITIPNVIGKAESIAKNDLKDLNVTVKYSEDASKSNGVVLSQSINGGTKAKKGDKITITVNKITEISVPNVVGMSETAARNTLKDFVVTVKYAEDKNKRDGTVIQQSLKNGIKAKKGDSITITLNKINNSTEDNEGNNDENNEN